MRGHKDFMKLAGMTQQSCAILVGLKASSVWIQAYRLSNSRAKVIDITPVIVMTSDATTLSFSKPFDTWTLGSKFINVSHLAFTFHNDC